MATFNSLKARKGILDLQAGVTVANLPAPSTYTGTPVRVVTNALNPIAGSIVAAGGTARAVVYNDGTNWRVLGGTPYVAPASLALIDLTPVAFASLPAEPALGMVRVVNNATETIVGKAANGGGSAKVLVWYNDTAWRIIGGTDA